MRSRLANFAQSDAKRLFKATAGVRVRVEFRPAGRATAEQERALATGAEEVSGTDKTIVPGGPFGGGTGQVRPSQRNSRQKYLPRREFLVLINYPIRPSDSFARCFGRGGSMSELPSDELSITASGANPGRRGAAAQARRARSFTATSAPAAVPIPVGLGAVDRALKQGADVYPRWVARGKLQQSIADYQVSPLEAVKATLEWCAITRPICRARGAEASGESRG